MTRRRRLYAPGQSGVSKGGYSGTWPGRRGISPAADLIGGLSREGAMYYRDEEDHLRSFEPLWWRPLSSEAAVPARNRWLRRLGTDPDVVLQNGMETRRFLARELYRVPEEWLDEVLRVRMAALLR